MSFLARHTEQRQCILRAQRQSRIIAPSVGKCGISCRHASLSRRVTNVLRTLVKTNPGSIHPLPSSSDPEGAERRAYTPYSADAASTHQDGSSNTDTGDALDASSAADVVLRFISALNVRDLSGMLLLLSEDCRHEDLSHQGAANSKEEVSRFYCDLVASLPERVVVAVDDITRGDPGRVGLMWHLEVDGVEVPCSRGLSFYRVSRTNTASSRNGAAGANRSTSSSTSSSSSSSSTPTGRQLITFVRQSPEHFIKLSGVLLTASASATPLIDSLGPMALPSFWSNLARGASNMLASAPPVEELLMGLAAAGAANAAPNVPWVSGTGSSSAGGRGGAGSGGAILPSGGVEAARPVTPPLGMFSAMPGRVAAHAPSSPAPSSFPSPSSSALAAAITRSAIAAIAPQPAPPLEQLPQPRSPPTTFATTVVVHAATLVSATAVTTAAAAAICPTPTPTPSAVPTSSAIATSTSITSPPSTATDATAASSTAAATDTAAAAPAASNQAHGSQTPQGHPEEEPREDYTLASLAAQSLLASSSSRHTATRNGNSADPAVAVTDPSRTATPQPGATGTGGAASAPAATPGAAVVPLSSLAGIWEKDLEASDVAGYERALDLWQISGVQKATARLIEGLELAVVGGAAGTTMRSIQRGGSSGGYGGGGGGALKVHFLTIIPHFKVTETYPLGGGRAQMRRRDQRSGHAQAYAEVVPNGVVCRAAWGAPFAGELEESYTLAPTDSGSGLSDVLHVTSTIRVGDNQQATTLQVYNRRRDMSSRDLLAESEKRNGSAIDVLRRFGMA